MGRVGIGIVALVHKPGNVPRAVHRCTPCERERQIGPFADPTVAN